MKSSHGKNRLLGEQTLKSLLYTLWNLLTLQFGLCGEEEEIQNSGPFYRAIIENPKSEVWYKKQRMGLNKIESFMKNMALEAELNLDGRKLINHSVQKALVKSNQPRSAIIGVPGRKSERSLADYKEGDEAQQRQILSIISSPVSQQAQNSRPVLSSLPIQYNPTATPASQTVVHHFHSCQVTINYGAGVGVLVFFNQAAPRHWEKLSHALS